MVINEKMNQMEPAVLEKKITGMASETEGLVSENNNMNLAVQSFDMTMAIKNRNVTAEIENLKYSMYVHSLARSGSSTTTEEE